ncbi:MAG: IS66 family transposase [Lentisphaeria bacterium]|nr:IS66 family transposase [Lentisphaeria bacterium]
MAAALIKLREEVQKRDETIAELDRQLKRQQGTIEQMQQQMADLLRRLYGRRSEKLDVNQLLMEGLILDSDGEATPPEAPPAEIPRAVKPKSKRNGRRPLPDHLPRHEIIVPAPEDEKLCPTTGKARPFIGYEDSEKLEYIPETLRVNVYRREKYGSPMGAEENGVFTAALPPTVVARCLADTGMLTHVAVSKFDDHQPLYRQERILLRQGVHISRKTMAGWLRAMGAGLNGLWELTAERILASGVVHHDDTPVSMLDPGAGKTKQTRFWIAVSGAGPPLVHFSFSLNRKQEAPKKFFAGYTGALMCDDYPGYANVDCGRLLSCWSHARRYVEKAKKVEPAFATGVLLEIAHLYRIEKAIREATDAERLEIRQTQSMNQLDVVFDLLQSREFRPQSPMHRATHYIMDNRQQLTRYTEDPRLPIDNNAAERAIRRVAIGRKNWMFLGSETGGQTAAVLMTLLGSCWANRINAWAYLKDVLDRLPSLPEDELEQLLPPTWIEGRPEARLPRLD